MTILMTVEVTILLLLTLVPPTHSAVLSDQISANIAALFNDYVDVDHARSVYDAQLRIQVVQPEDLQEDLANRTAEAFGAALIALSTLKHKAIQHYHQHTWVNQSKGLLMERSDSWDYWDGFSRPITQIGTGDVMKVSNSQRYKHKINDNYSAIYLPVDVHDSWTEVNNTISWTRHLDETFRSNHEKVKHISWQYIGSPTGVLRSFPASPADQKFYDVRKRPWYTAGVGCPKDIILLIDVSGSLNLFVKFIRSMAFSFFELAITDTDFINVISVKEKPEFVTCLDHMMRATPAVISSLTDSIKLLEPAGKSNWTAALELAFETFHNSREINQSTFCEQAIVMFTDRTSQPIDLVLDRLNADRAVRVFVFSFKSEKGTIQLKKDILEDIACQNRGYYKKILSYGVVENTMQHMIQVGNDQLQDLDDIAATWSNSFNGSWGNSMLITATLPMVTATSESEKKSTEDEERHAKITLLGVVGVDMSPEIIKTIVEDMLPWGTSSFMLNNKGYPVYHFREDKYRYNDMNVRLHRFQHTQANKKQLINMEKHMMQQVEMGFEIESFISSEGQERAAMWYQKQHYHTFPVHGTPFSLAVIYSDNHPSSYAVSKNETCFNTNAALSILSTVWAKRVAVSTMVKGFLQQFKAQSEGVETCFSEVEMDGIKNNTIYTNIMLSESLQGTFKDTKDAVNQFIISSAGLTYYNLPLFEQGYANISHHDLMLYRRVSRAPPGTLFVSMPHAGVINITREVKLSQCQVESCKVAVVGVKVPVSLFTDKVYSNSAPKERLLLVNENGMIVDDSEATTTGAYLGTRFGTLTRKLILNNVYTKVEYNECIDWCKKRPLVAKGINKFLGNSGQRLTPSILRLAWDTGVFLTQQLKLISMFLMSMLAPVVQADPTHRNMVPCCRVYHHLQRNFTTALDKPLSLQHKDCMLYRVRHVSGTNLLLVKIIPLDVSNCPLLPHGIPLLADWHTIGRPETLADIGEEQNCSLAHAGDNLTGTVSGGSSKIPGKPGYGKYAQYYVQRKTCRLGNYNASEEICVRSSALSDWMWNGFLIGTIVFLVVLKMVLE